MVLEGEAKRVPYPVTAVSAMAVPGMYPLCLSDH